MESKSGNWKQNYELQLTLGKIEKEFRLVVSPSVNVPSQIFCFLCASVRVLENAQSILLFFQFFFSWRLYKTIYAVIDNKSLQAEILF